MRLLQCKSSNQIRNQARLSIFFRCPKLFACFALFSFLTSCQTTELNEKRFVIERMWTRSTLGEPYYGFRALHRMSPIITKERIYTANAIDGMVAYNRKTGDLIWRFPIDGGVEAGASLTEGKLYFGASDGYFYCLDALSGRQVWKFPIRAEGLGLPLVNNGRVYFVAGNSIAYSLDAATGKQFWLYNRRNPSALSIRGSSQPSISDGQLFVGFSDGFIVSLNSDTGTVNWETDINPNQRFKDVDSHPVVVGSRIYVTSYDGGLYCLNKNKGDILWQTNEGAFSAPLIIGKNLFYSTSNGQVIKLDKGSGKKLWERTLRNGNGTRPQSYKGMLVFGEFEGGLQFWNAEDGNPIGMFEPGRGVTSSASIDPQSGEVFFMSANANIFALRAQWKPYLQTWPWQ